MMTLERALYGIDESTVIHVSENGNEYFSGAMWAYCETLDFAFKSERTPKSIAEKGNELYIDF